MTVWLEHGDMREVLPRLLAEKIQIDAIVTDPPYHLTSIVQRFGADDAAPAKTGKTGAYARASAGFMGKKWDGGDIAFQMETWRACYDLLPPGGHLLAFCGTRTYHRMVCAIEDAGFEIRDSIAWIYGSGFPKSHNVARGIDRMNGDARPVTGTEKVRDIRNDHGRGLGDGINAANRDGPVYMERDLTKAASAASAAWEGWGTALKPAMELICVARKPLIGTVVANVLAHGVGALNIDGCRVGTEGGGTLCNRRDESGKCLGHPDRSGTAFGLTYQGPESVGAIGRWPANVIHDGSEEVISAFPIAGGQRAAVGPKNGAKTSVNVYGDYGPRDQFEPRGDSGSAARFFYSAKANKKDRGDSKHPTVKPISLMRYLVRLITPPGGVVLDPFAGSGTTGEACDLEGFDCVLVEREDEYAADIRRRIPAVQVEA